MKKKKVYAQEVGIGYCPFSFCVQSRYNRLYRDTGCIAGVHGQEGQGHDMATTRLSGRLVARHDMANPRARHGMGFYVVTQILCRDGGWGETARACLGSALVVSRYKFCIMTGGGDTTLRHGIAIRSSVLATRRAVRATWLVSRYKFCIAKGKAALCRHIARDTAATLQRALATRSGTTMTMAPVRATTRPNARCDKAMCSRLERSARAACAQPRPWMCALCTQPSFDSVHCSESLFFNTVHEV